MQLYTLVISVLQVVTLVNSDYLIPDTGLQTFLPYQFQLFSFPEGYMVPADEKTKAGYQYVITDNNNGSLYENCGRTYSSWIFSPFSGSQGGNADWYEIHNTNYPGKLTTNNEEEGDSKYLANNYYVTLNTNYYPNDAPPEWNDRFLWRPYLISYNSKNYFQLVNKARRRAVFTYTTKKYQDRGFYLQLDNSNDTRYYQGGEWYTDSLLKITEVGH